MKYKIIVTEDHWIKGKQGEGVEKICPVALAMKDAGVKNPEVNRSGRQWYFKCGGPSNPRVLPKDLKSIAVTFDHQKRYPKPNFPITSEIDTQKWQTFN